MAQREKQDDGPQQIVLEGVRLIFRNFSGEARNFNSAGDRNFNVVLPEDVAKAMEADGWNVRWLPPREEEDPPQPVLKVRLKYSTREGRPTRPPLVVLVSVRPDGTEAKTTLTQELLPVLDSAEISNVDLIINPYHYNAQGRSGISAYLKSIFVTIRVDPLEARYMDVPETSAPAFSSGD